MRALTTLGIFGLLTFSAVGHADPPRPPPPHIAFQLASVKGMGTFGTQYHGGRGALTFVVDVENPLKTAIPGVQVEWTWQPLPMWPALASPVTDTTNWGYAKNVDLKPGANGIAFTPNESLPVCGNAAIMVKLFPDGGPSLDNTLRRTTVRTKNCAYSAAFQNPWDQMEPDRVDDAKKNVVYINNVTMNKPPDCTKSEWIEVRFELVNRTDKDGDMMIQIGDPDGKTSLALQGVSIKKGQTIHPIVTMYRPTRTGTLSIHVVGSNWQGKNPIPVAAQATSLAFTGVCEVSVDPIH